jgi:poly-beta-1,6-N-acetyl-D-glucosamine biosynthesis protein PgaD
MKSANRPWPPLIVAAHVPRAVKWRDFLLTLMLWGAFWLLLDEEFELLFNDLLKLVGITRVKAGRDWQLYLDLLVPYLLIAAALASALVIFAMRTAWRRRRAMLAPQPTPLEAADQARRAGLDEKALVAAREQRIVIVHIDILGGHRIEVPHARQSAVVGGGP